MASQHQRERQCVYLSYRGVFCGSKARVRKGKAIRRIVLKHSARSGIVADEHHVQKTIIVLKALLKDRVFESERRARKTFPSLFTKLPLAPPAITSSSKHDVMSLASTDTKRQKRTDDVEGLAPCLLHGSLTVERKHEICAPLVLPPIRFPFQAQHHVLSRIQQLLEETCFRFMEKWLPSTLVQRDWTCAAAMELTQSLSLIRMNLKMLPNDCMDASNQSLFIKIAPDIARLRHAAVHRLHLEHDEFLQQINCARTLARILQHPENLEILQIMHSRVDVWIKKVDYEAKVVKQKADLILSQLSQQAEVLVQREQQLRNTVAQNHIELAAAAGRAILEPIKALLPTSGSESTKTRDAAREPIDYGATVDENDIESDEDRLQAELE